MVHLTMKAAIWAVAFMLLSVPAIVNGEADMVCSDDNGSCPWNNQLENSDDGGHVQTLPGAEAAVAALDRTDPDLTTTDSRVDGLSGHSPADMDLWAPGAAVASSNEQAGVAAAATAAASSTGGSFDLNPDPQTATAPASDAAAPTSGESSSQGAGAAMTTGLHVDAIAPTQLISSQTTDAQPGNPATDELPSGLSPDGPSFNTSNDVRDPSAAGSTPEAPGGANATERELPMDQQDSNPLHELRSLLQQARLAVARLEAEVTLQESRLVGLAAAAAAAAAAPMPALEAGAGGAADQSVAVTAATVAALRSLGIDGSRTSAAARQALREALQLVLKERPRAGGSETAYVGSSRMAAGVGERDWFNLHFAPRTAVRLAPPQPPPAAAPVEPTAAQLPAAITCAFVYELPLPDAAANGGGALQYIVLGDAAGSLYFLSAANGSVLAALSSGTNSPVTACSAYYMRRYESTLVTGHANGQTRSFLVSMQEVQEDAPTAAAGEDGAAAAAAAEQQQQERRRQRDGSRRTAPSKLAVQSVRLRHVVESMPGGALPWAAVEELPLGVAAAMAPAAAPAGEPAGGESAGGQTALAGAAPPAPAPATGAVTVTDYKGPPAPIMHILPYRLGNRPTGRRHVLVLDRAGNLRLDRDNGTTRFFARTNRTQLAVRFVGTHVVMLSSYHATLLNTLQPRPPRAFSCHQLNGSRLLAASFDGHRPFRGYGINTRGELLSLVTPHEGGLTTCKAHRATPLPWLDAEQLVGDPAARHLLSLTPLRGYLLLTHGSQRVMFNVTGVVRSGIPTLTSASDDVIADVTQDIAHPLEAVAPTTLSDPEGAATGAAAGLIGGLLPPTPIVAVGPGSQVVVLALPTTGTATPPVQLDADEVAAGEGGVAAAAVAGGGGAVGAAPLVVVLDSRMSRPPMAGATSKIWSQPVFIAAMLLVGLYQFWRMSNSRVQRRTSPSASRGMRNRRSYGAGYGGASYGDAAEYMYGESKVPLQPRSALRRGRSDRPMGRSVSYEDDDY